MRGDEGWSATGRQSGRLRGTDARSVPTRRAVLRAPRAALLRQAAPEAEFGLGPLPRRGFLRHLTRTTVEHGVAAALWSHSVRRSGLVPPLLGTVCRRVLNPVEEFRQPS